MPLYKPGKQRAVPSSPPLTAPSSPPKSYTEPPSPPKLTDCGPIADQTMGGPLSEVQDALRRQGLERSNLIIAVDYTKSNEWTGKYTFEGRNLHALDGPANPYQTAMSIIARTLAPFDKDRLISAIGFGDVSTQDNSVFNFFPAGLPAEGLDELVARYRELTPCVKLAGPTSFAPAIYEGMRMVAASGNEHHVLVIIADGQVTRGCDVPDGRLSVQEEETARAISEASGVPLSIVLIGVGDGPWHAMKADLDGKLPARKWDNFHFVNFTEISMRHAADPARLPREFAQHALMKVPQQLRDIRGLNLPSGEGASSYVLARVPLDPPDMAAPERASDSSSSSCFSAAGTSRSASASPDPMLICPLTNAVMDDPVVAADGFTYERAAIAKWLQSHYTSPLSNAVLEHAHLTPNNVLRSSIKEWQLQRHRCHSSAIAAP